MPQDYPGEYVGQYVGSPLVSILARTLSTRQTLRRIRNPLTPHEIVPMLIGSTVEAIERELVLQTLARCDGNRTHAARLLGLSVRTMRNKIKQYATSGADVPSHS